MSESTIASLVGLGVFLALRLIDALLPKGYHLRVMERFIRRDDDPAQPEDEKG